MKKKQYLIAASIMLIPLLLFGVLYITSNIEEWTMSEESKMVVDLIKFINANPQGMSLHSHQLSIEDYLLGMKGQMEPSQSNNITITGITTVPKAPITKRNPIFEVVKDNGEPSISEGMLIKVEYAVHNLNNYDERTLYYDSSNDLLFTKNLYYQIRRHADDVSGTKKDYFERMVDTFTEDQMIIRLAENERKYTHRVYPLDYIKELVEKAE